MRILSAYCPHCDANRPVTVLPEGETSTLDAPHRWHRAVVVSCPAGHALVRLGAAAGPDPVADLLLGGSPEAETKLIVIPVPVQPGGSALP